MDKNKNELTFYFFLRFNIHIILKISRVISAMIFCFRLLKLTFPSKFIYTMVKEEFNND